MEAIAAEAGIAKATLYGYFADKDAVFAGCSKLWCQSCRRRSTVRSPGREVSSTGSAWHSRPSTRRCSNCSRVALRRRTLQRPKPTRRPVFAALEARIEAAVIGELELAGVARARPLAQILIASAGGIGHKAQTAAEVGPAIRLLTERLLGPEVRSMPTLVRSPHPELHE